MKAIEFMKLKRFEKPLFTVNDISKLTGKNKNYLKVYLYRLKKKNIINELERGKYYFSETEPLAIASNVIFPCYISFFTALRYYNYTTQMPKTIFVACLKSKKQIKNEYEIKFVKLSKKRFFGYKRERFHEKFIFIAEIEKTIVDSLFLPEYCPIDEIFNAINKKEFDIKKLLNYTKAMDSMVLLKRLGYMLDISGIDIRKKVKINNKFDLLNPFLPKSKNKNYKWRIIVNEDLHA